MDAQRPGAVSAPNDLDRRLREAGLRSTRPRVTVLGVLDAQDGHLSADELVVELGRRGTSLPRSTVFNVLDDLVEAGLAFRADLGSGASRYESAATRSPHHHFVCRRCGEIHDVPLAVALDDLGDVAHPHRVDAVDVVLRGLCERCAAGQD